MWLSKMVYETLMTIVATRDDAEALVARSGA
jgi:hypothetical protein